MYSNLFEIREQLIFQYNYYIILAAGTNSSAFVSRAFGYT